MSCRCLFWCSCLHNYAVILLFNRSVKNFDTQSLGRSKVSNSDKIAKQLNGLTVQRSTPHVAVIDVRPNTVDLPAQVIILTSWLSMLVFYLLFQQIGIKISYHIIEFIVTFRQYIENRFEH